MYVLHIQTFKAIYTVNYCLFEVQGLTLLVAATFAEAKHHESAYTGTPETSRMGMAVWIVLLSALVMLVLYNFGRVVGKEGTRGCWPRQEHGCACIQATELVFVW